MRSTSIEVYRKIEAEGLLKNLRWVVYSFLYWNGPMTCREVMTAIRKKNGKSFVIADGSLSSRFSELERMGVVTAVGTRKCRETNNEVTLWDVTANLPAKFEKPDKQKCCRCNGTGYVAHAQGKLF